MGFLETLQDEHAVWQQKNFGAQATGENSFLGMVEEMGEMAHAWLKFKQGIRGIDRETFLAKIIDGHCDLIIFGMGMATDLGYVLEDHLEQTWAKVKTRDWVADPEKGGQA